MEKDCKRGGEREGERGRGGRGRERVGERAMEKRKKGRLSLERAQYMYPTSIKCMSLAQVTMERAFKYGDTGDRKTHTNTATCSVSISTVVLSI